MHVTCEHLTSGDFTSDIRRNEKKNTEWQAPIPIANFFSSRVQSTDFTTNFYKILLLEYILSTATRGGVVVRALRYKPAGRVFDSQWRHWNFSVT